MQSMGGGGAMRAAAKVAGVRVVKGGLRGGPAASPAENTAARDAVRPMSVTVSSSDELKSSVLTASQNNAIDAAVVQRPCWEIDDWEFAGAEEELMVKSGEPMPRLVFGGAPPTLQEAKEATSELKDALEKLLGEKTCVTSEAAAVSVPKNALKAFRLLNESTAAQNVVASIASDPNVWHAVLHNEALTTLLESQKGTASFLDTDQIVKESVPNTKFTDEQSTCDESGDSGKSGDSGNRFSGFMHNIKAKVINMLSSLSDYFQPLFGGLTEEKDSGGNAKSIIAASFMGLAVMVIMVVVLKRV